MSDNLQKAGILAFTTLKSVSRKPFKPFLNPFETGNRPLIIHACYHKVQTVWFKRVLRDVAAHFSMNFQASKQHNLRRTTEIWMQDHSEIEFHSLGDYRASHIIRDPRDVIVSGYFYHKWTSEPGPNQSKKQFNGKSYQQVLNELPQDEGLCLEIKKAQRFWLPDMVAWNYDNPHCLEIRYEEMLNDEEAIFKRVFEHYGFSEEAVNVALGISHKYQLNRVKKKTSKKSHFRSGQSGQWQSLFTERHKDLFKELYPGALTALGYETDDNW